uniref:ATP synthase complex subunit 8 n=1 Tax=Ellipsidion sp. BLA050 TaxID=2093463 RepID=A0A2P1H973_9NEOP|nr:ATP synthase F0 subunit 8 [Ellipsidion sp. BLA050]
MPQMMPMNWPMLYIMFLMIFIMFNIVNYYNIIPLKKVKSSKGKTKNKILNWKW